MIFTPKRRLTKAGLCACVCACVFFFPVFLYVFLSIYVSDASGPPYALKEEMNDESTKKYFQKNNNNNNSNNKIKQKKKLTSSMIHRNLRFNTSFFNAGIKSNLEREGNQTGTS